MTVLENNESGTTQTHPLSCSFRVSPTRGINSHSNKDLVGAAAAASKNKVMSEKSISSKEAPPPIAEVPPHNTSYLSMDARTASWQLKLWAAIGYGLMSIAIMMISKAILTEFNFRCFIFVGFLQYTSTSLILMLQAHYRGNPFPMKGIFNILFVELFPLPMVFMFNTLSGLGATQALNMPLFILLRRLSIVMTLLCEAIVLRYRHDWEAHAAVFLMILGAMAATSYDTNIPLTGVAFVLVNDVCTALNGVLTRWKMDVSKINSEGIMFYSNVFASFFSGIMLLGGVRGEIKMLWEFNGWSTSFLILLCINAVSGFCINYLAYLCMKLNSPLTVSMIGAGKNVITSYIGMMFRDYKYSTSSFIGVNISVIGCILYSHREMVRILGRHRDDEKQNGLAKKESPEKELEDHRESHKQ